MDPEGISCCLVASVSLCSTAVLHDWVWWQLPLFLAHLILVSASCSNKGWDGAAQVLTLVKVHASHSFISKVCRSQITVRAFHSLSGKVSTIRERKHTLQI